jgi:hypothetical protein
VLAGTWGTLILFCVLTTAAAIWMSFSWQGMDLSRLSQAVHGFAADE